MLGGLNDNVVNMVSKFAHDNKTGDVVVSESKIITGSRIIEEVR